MSAVASLSAADQGYYDIVKNLLLATYQVTTEAYRKNIFEQAFDTANPGNWLSKHQQSFKQWLESSDKDPELLMILETTYRKLPKWLETQTRNLNPETFEELTEVVVRHLGNQQRPDKPIPKLTTRHHSRHSSSVMPYRSKLPEPNQLKMGRGRGVGHPQHKDVRSMECFRCGKRGYMRRDYKVGSINYS